MATETFVCSCFLLMIGLQVSRSNAHPFASLQNQNGLLVSPPQPMELESRKYHIGNKWTNKVSGAGGFEETAADSSVLQPPPTFQGSQIESPGSPPRRPAMDVLLNALYLIDFLMSHIKVTVDEAAVDAKPGTIQVHEHLELKPEDFLNSFGDSAGLTNAWEEKPAAVQDMAENAEVSFNELRLPLVSHDDVEPRIVNYEVDLAE